ncbi:MAG: hypothetical protein CMN21_18080 [Rubinisphaera sp.]|nr:hypothetical protein [Rubinisphaera sp.]
MESSYRKNHYRHVRVIHRILDIALLELLYLLFVQSARTLTTKSEMRGRMKGCVRTNDGQKAE